MSTASRRPGPRLVFRPQPWIVAVLIFTTFGAIFLTPAREAAAAPAWTTTWLNLRSGPGTNYGVILVMEPGAYVEIVQNKQNGFYRVRYNGVSGWAALQYLDRSGGGNSDGGGGGGGGGSGNATVTSALNLRSSPWGSIIAVMPAGASVTVTGSGQNGFLPVTYNGQSGWAHTDYLDTGASGPGPSPAPPSGPAVGSATTTTALNLRAGPSTGTSVLAVMPGGASVEILGDPQSGFYPVRYNGTSGYASGDFLNFGGDGDGGGGGGGGDGWTEQEIINIIYAAADRYGQPRADMLRVARCESNLNPNTYHPAYGASGLFQFLPGTWATTPYANENIFDPVASANAAGWMWSVGRRGEWVCQ
ncbi:MAG: SH3 domain-containing protein [Thermomicrobiales bacterium]